MNLYEAKKFLNDNGYLLEDRFGGGKDRYGHKIKRLKLSDLDNDETEETEEPTEISVADEPVDNVKTDEPTGQIAAGSTVDSEQLLKFTVDNLYPDFPGYCDLDNDRNDDSEYKGLVLVIHDELHNDEDYFKRAEKIYGDIQYTTNKRYDNALDVLGYYIKRYRYEMESKIAEYLKPFKEYIKHFVLRTSGCDNILSVDLQFDYESLYNTCGNKDKYIEQLKEFNNNCVLVSNYLRDWIEANLGTK